VNVLVQLRIAPLFQVVSWLAIVILRSCSGSRHEANNQTAGQSKFNWNAPSHDNNAACCRAETMNIHRLHAAGNKLFYVIVVLGGSSRDYFLRPLHGWSRALRMSGRSANVTAVGTFRQKTETWHTTNRLTKACWFNLHNIIATPHTCTHRGKGSYTYQWLQWPAVGKWFMRRPVCFGPRPQGHAEAL
jgi:hypothetical protein